MIRVHLLLIWEVLPMKLYKDGSSSMSKPGEPPWTAGTQQSGRLKQVKLAEMV